MTVRHAFLIAIILRLSSFACSAELPSGATLLDPDIVWDLEPDVVSERQDPAFAISPDDKSIAYISKGTIWKCNIIAGPPTKLVDLPNTKTAFLATPQYRVAWSNLSKIPDHHDRQVFLGKLPQGLVDVCSLALDSFPRWRRLRSTPTLAKYSRRHPTVKCFMLLQNGVGHT